VVFRASCALGELKCLELSHLVDLNLDSDTPQRIAESDGIYINFDPLNVFTRADDGQGGRGLVETCSFFFAERDP